MADRRKGRKKKEAELKDDDAKPTKEEYAAAKYLRQHLPEKKTTLLGHKVDYFIASKAIDCLLDSPWSTNKAKSNVIFTTRESVVEFLDRMLQHKFFHRARKIVVQKDGKKKKKEEEKKKDKDSEINKKKESEENKKKEKEAEEKKKETKEKKEDKKESEDVTEPKKEKELKKEKAKTKGENDNKTEEKDGDLAEKKKEKKKIKLDMHMEQIFVDGNEPYVWIYDPIPMRTWINGTLMVVGAVLVCLFPLWPRTIRHYIYYLSIAAAGFLVFIIGLAVVRLVVFVVIWMVTLGKHHLWLLPNLTEDVGFFESFWPLYNYEYKGSKNSKERKKESKDINSENKELGKSDSSTDQEAKVDVDQAHSESEQDSESDKKKADNGENGFEIVDAEDVDQCEIETKEDK